MSDWISTLSAVINGDEVAVLVTVLETKGSAPRGSGTRMLVFPTRLEGTIGGGALEHQCIQQARRQLDSAETGTPARFVQQFTLGPGLQQCCGGIVTVAFEYLNQSSNNWLSPLMDLRKTQTSAVLMTMQQENTINKWVITEQSLPSLQLPKELHDKAITAAKTLLDHTDDEIIMLSGAELPFEQVTLTLELMRPVDFQIMLFGAGHVGKAVVSVLAGLPCDITWVDNRPDEFPQTVADNVRIVVSENPESEVGAAADGTYFLVMTHSHPLDFAICLGILSSNKFAYCGLIGSLSKRNKFNHRLRKAGISEQRLADLICPIGTVGISSKHPAAIAIAVAAELVVLQEANCRAMQSVPSVNLELEKRA